MEERCSICGEELSKKDVYENGFICSYCVDEVVIANNKMAQGRNFIKNFGWR